MNAPEPKKLWFGFHRWVLMSLLDQLRPLIPERPSNVSMLMLPGAFLLSNQMARSLPFGVTSIHGKNWSFGAGVPEPLIATSCMFDQVWPESFGFANEMSAPLS